LFDQQIKATLGITE